MKILVGLFLLFFSVGALANLKVIQQYLPEAEVVGEARLKVMLWNVYDATLYAPEGRWQPEQPFALSLDYLRELKGEKIAERSIEEMRKLGFSDSAKLNQWQKKLLEIFPDVDEDTQITGIRTQEGHSLFLKNGEQLALIEDEEFTRWFFKIWLDEETSEPEMRERLLGMQ